MNLADTQYTLTGIIVHLGTLNNGHYYSYIKLPDENKWMEFNDHKIKEFDLNPKRMDFFCFGGKTDFKTLEELW